MMLSFISGSNNNREVRKLLQDVTELKCAVAFLGKEALKLFKKRKGHTWLICNLESGSTNPYIIPELMKLPELAIRTNSKLHAKVYWTPHKAIVSSANISINGLGFEETAGWIEAGILVDDNQVIESIEKWFEGLWNKSQKITNLALDKACENWQKRALRGSEDSLSKRKSKKTSELDLPISTDDSINKAISNHIGAILQKRDCPVGEIKTEIAKIDSKLHDRIAKLCIDGKRSTPFGKSVEAALDALRKKGRAKKVSYDYGSNWKLVRESVK